MIDEAKNVLRLIGEAQEALASVIRILPPGEIKGRMIQVQDDLLRLMDIIVGS